MYSEFYNFSAEPFRITPDPGFLYLTDQHKEALAAIIYGIARRKGFVCITGEVGVGKTTILRSYLDGVDEPGLRFVYVYNPNVSFLALLRHLFKELGLPLPGDDIAAMVEALQDWLRDAHARRETLVLLIDEAQNMPVATLENLRMLSNLETPTEKLVQIVLVGQPELETLLAERQLRQVESRIAVRTRLGPLSRADSVAYIRHRLKCVALDDKPAFTDEAMRLIARHADGIPRRINVICDNALMSGLGRKARPVTEDIVAEVLHDLRAKDGDVPPLAALAAEVMARLRQGIKAVPPRRLAVAGGATVAMALALGAGMTWRKPAPAVHGPVAHETPAASAAAPRFNAVIAPPPSRPQPEATAIAVPTAIGLTALPAGEAGRRTRIVAPGDTLTGLATQVYGKVDRSALEWVRSHNPGLTDIDRLLVGQVIEFPPLPAGGGN